MYKIHKVNGRDVRVYEPTEKTNCYMICINKGSWLIGNYDSEQAALMGAELDLKKDPRFYEIQDRVNHFRKEDRNITCEDIQHLLEES